jgi:hypothetical protein
MGRIRAPDLGRASPAVALRSAGLDTRPRPSPAGRHPDHAEPPGPIPRGTTQGADPLGTPNW